MCPVTPALTSRIANTPLQHALTPAKASINRQHLAADTACAIRREKDDSIGNILLCRRPLAGLFGEPLAPAFRITQSFGGLLPEELDAAFVQHVARANPDDAHAAIKARAAQRSCKGDD
jgi:hypothetical protein